MDFIMKIVDDRVQIHSMKEQQMGMKRMRGSDDDQGNQHSVGNRYPLNIEAFVL